MQDNILPRKENNSSLYERSTVSRSTRFIALISNRDNIKARNNLGQPRKVADTHDKRVQKCLLKSISVVSTRAM